MSTSNDQDNRLRRLIDRLEQLVGTPSTGYYGSILIDDDLRALVGVARSELQELLRFKERLEWLHQGGGKHDCDAEGYEWGVARLKFNEHGQFVNALWTNSDHRDLDAEMARSRKAS